MAMEEALTSRGTSEYDEITVELADDTQDTVEQAKRSLVGKFFSEKISNRGEVKTVVSQAWGDPDGLQITDLGPNIFLFTFKDKRETVDIMKKGPWFVMNHLLNLQRWIPEASVFEIDFARVPFWVQLHGMPLGTMNIPNASKIAQQIGEIIDVENPRITGNLVRSFMRVRILINVYKPLLTGCWVPRKDLPKSWVVFRYEKLQGMCFNCGVIGHEQQSCKRGKVMSVVNGKIPRYSGQLGIPSAKPLSVIATEMGQWRSKNPPQAAGDSSLRRHKAGVSSFDSKVKHQWEEDAATPEEEHSGVIGKNREMMMSTVREEAEHRWEKNCNPKSFVWDQVLEVINGLQAGKSVHGGGVVEEQGGGENLFVGEASSSRTAEIRCQEWQGAKQYCIGDDDHSSNQVDGMKEKEGEGLRGILLQKWESLEVDLVGPREECCARGSENTLEAWRCVNLEGQMSPIQKQRDLTTIVAHSL